MRRRSYSTTAGILALVAGILGIWKTVTASRHAGTTAPPPVSDAPLLKPGGAAPAAIPPGAEPVAVKRAVDGDTVELADGRKVRYLGVDTPEKGENFYDTATALNAKLVAGREAWLEFDVEKTDRYGRLLAFVWVQEGNDARLVNAEIIRAGLAYVYTPGPNAKHKDALLACQREAREQGRGFWKDYVFGRESAFVTTRNGHAFHKKGCDAIKDANASSLKTWTTREQVVDAGFSACRTCKP
jgi:micrococcal nuclease